MNLFVWIWLKNWATGVVFVEGISESFTALVYGFGPSTFCSNLQSEGPNFGGFNLWVSQLLNKIMNIISLVFAAFSFRTEFNCEVLTKHCNRHRFLNWNKCTEQLSQDSGIICNRYSPYGIINFIDSLLDVSNRLRF